MNASLLWAATVLPDQGSAFCARDFLHFLFVVLPAKALAAFWFAAFYASGGTFVHPLVVGSICEFKIFDPVVAAVPIFMMDQFCAFESSSKVFSHYESMFQDVTIPIGLHVPICQNQNVPAAVDRYSTLPCAVKLRVVADPFKEATSAPCICARPVSTAPLSAVDTGVILGHPCIIT